MAGRPPKPVNAINNKVSHRTEKELADRRTSEPQFIKPCRLKCPDKLTAEAKIIWQQLIKLHKKLTNPIWTDFDVPSLARYCEHRAMMDKAQDEWLVDPKIIIYNQDATGDGKMNTAATQLMKLSKLLISEEDKLCISVIGRARVGTANANTAKPADYDEMLD